MRREINRARLVFLSTWSLCMSLAPGLAQAEPPPAANARGAAVGVSYGAPPQGATYDPTTTASPDILGREAASMGSGDAIWIFCAATCSTSSLDGS